MTTRLGTPRNLLLVEDNPAEAFLIQDYLEASEGRRNNVAHVETLGAAVRSLRNGAIDAILLDLGLPDGIGVECVRTIRACADGVPIVVLTGMDHEELAVDCIQAGAQDYIPKQKANADSLRRAVSYSIARMSETNAKVRADALQARLAAIVESSRDAIFSCSPTGEVRTWNAGAEAIFGYSAAEAIGRPVEQLIRPLDATDAARQLELKQQASKGELFGNLDLVRAGKDGRPIDISVTTRPLQSAGGEPYGFSAIARDVTAKKQYERQLLQRNAELLARDRQMQALAGRLNSIREAERIHISREVHDDLGQLLTGLKMDLRWIARRVDPQGGPSNLAILDKLDEAGTLVDRTVETVQRIATELRPSALDALGLAATIRDEARRFENRTGVRTTVTVAETKPPSDEVATALFRIFQEIITNISRHAQATNVTVSVDCSEEFCSLKVVDDGVGFLHDENTTRTSLGLLSMKERAALLGGTVDITTAVGEGVCVRVSIRN